MRLIINFAALVALCLLFSVSANSQAPTPTATPTADQKWSGFVEGAATLKSDAQFGQINLSAAKGHFWVWAQADKGYQEIYAGPRFNAGPVEVGVAVGAENVGSNWRLGAYDIYGHKRLSQLNLWEHGASGFWFRNETNVEVTKKFSVGLFGQRFAGWGVRCGLKFRHSELWVATLEQHGGPTVLLGLRRNF